MFLPTIGLLVAIGCGSTNSGAADEASTDETTSSSDPVTPDLDSTGGSTSTAGSPEDEENDESGTVSRPDLGGTDGEPLGELCNTDPECASGHCFFVPGLPIGICSECAADADCMQDGGPGTCSLEGSWAVCTSGEAGTMCQSSEGCANDLVCASIWELLPFLYCSECATQDDCAALTLCSPTIDSGNACVEPGSVALHEPCPRHGDAACESGHCTELSDRGEGLGFYLCGECSHDDDCGPGGTCNPAWFDDASWSGSTCA